MKNIEENKFKKGDKVVPHGKSIWGKKAEDSAVWREAKKNGQGYLYFNKYYEGAIHSEIMDEVVILGLNENSISGDIFLASDIEHYDEVEEIIEELDLKYKMVSRKLKEKIGELAVLQLEQEEIVEKKERILKNGILLDKKALAEEYLQSNISDGCVEYNDVLFGTVLPIPYFVTKEKKGVVTLVLKGVASRLIYHKTQSKCMKTDEFSEVVGKAICLARALGDKKIEEQLTK